MSTLPAGEAADTLAAVQRIAAALAVLTLALAVAAEWIPRGPGAGLLVGPAGILGIVSPAIGYRLYHLLRERTPAAVDERERRARFSRASILGLGVTAAAALFGSSVFARTGELSALIGVVSHTILTGALWPTREKLETFCDEASPQAEAPVPEDRTTGE